MVYPNDLALSFCDWLLNVSWQKLSGPQKIIVQAVQTAAGSQSSVSDQTWTNFNLFTSWRYPFFRVYYDLIQTDLMIYDISSLRSSGKRYSFPYTDAALNRAAGFNGSMIFIPVPIGRSHAINALTINTAAAVIGSNVRLAVYASTVADYPGELLFDSGAVSGNVAGDITANISPAINLVSTDRLYFVAYQIDSAALSVIFSANPVALLQRQAGTNACPQQYRSVAAFGAFPNPAPAAMNPTFTWSVLVEATMV